MLVTIRDTIEFEMNCSTDNPLVLNKEEKCEFTGKMKPHLLSAGNFHGEYPAKALDTMVLYVGEIGRASAARVSMLVDPSRNRELPAFLASDAGLDSGFMCWELTAAALDAENRTLSMPASAETINTGAGKEDHVSMGGFGARKAVQVIENVQKIMTIELMAGIHAVHRRIANTSGTPGTGKDFRLPPLLQRLFDKVAPMSPSMECDRYLKDDYDDLLHYVMHELPLDADLVNP
jgi:histidine ammonia-lyase